MAFGLISSPRSMSMVEALERGRDAVSDVVHDSEEAVRDNGFVAFLLLASGTRRSGVGSTPEWWVAFSGRIFEIADSPMALTGNLAAQKVAELLSELGTGIFPSIYGEFAIWAFNRTTGTLLLARDPLGIEPIYYSVLELGVATGDELRAVAAMRGGRSDLSEDQASRCLVAHLLADISPEITWIDGVSRVPPGCFVSLASDGSCRPVTTRYWDPSKIIRDPGITGSEAASELRRLLESAITHRYAFGSDVGCHLSGGLDSSSIAVLLGLNARSFAGIHGFSWTPKECLSYGGTELARIAFLEKKFGIRCHHPDGDRFLKASDCWSRVSPTFPSVMVGYEWETLNCARSLGLREIFSGWGGDEFCSHSGLMSGVELVAKGRLVEAWKWAVRFDSGYGYPAAWRGLLRVVTEFLPLVAGSIFWVKPDTLSTRSLSRGDLRRYFAGFPAPLSVAALQDALYFRGHLVNRIESWASAGALVGVKYSYPLLDQRLVELCFSLPSQVYCNPGRSRAVFRDAVADLWDGFGSSNVPKADTAFQRFIFERGGAGFGNSGRAALEIVRNYDLARRLINEEALCKMVKGQNWADPNVVAVLEHCGDLARKIAAMEDGVDYRACLHEIECVGAS